MDEAIERADGNGLRARAGAARDGHASPRTSSRARSPSASASTTSTSRVYRVDPDAAKLVTPAAVKRYQAVPVSFAGDRTLLVAMADPANVLAVDDIAVMTGYEVRPAVASPRRHRAAARAPRRPRLRNGAVAPLEDDEDDPEPHAASAAPTPAGPLYDLREQRRSTSAPRARTRRSSSS